MFGVPPEIKFTLTLVFVPLTLLSAVLTFRQWRKSSGSMMASLRYSALTSCNLLFLVVLRYWNILGYYFSRVGRFPRHHGSGFRNKPGLIALAHQLSLR